MTDSHRATRSAGRPLARMLAALTLACCLAWSACGQGTGSRAAGKGAGGGAQSPGFTAAAPASSPTPPTPPPPLIDACELLTPADAKAVAKDVSGSLSSTLEDAVGKDPGQCAYPFGSAVPSRVISLVVRRLPSAEQAANQHQAAQSGLGSLSSSSPVEEVPRLGDGAFWIGGQLDQLHVLRGNTILIFTVQLDQEPLRAARLLAGKALARLAGPGSPGPPSRGGGSTPAPAGGNPQPAAPPHTSGGTRR